MSSIGKDLHYFSFEQTNCCVVYCGDHLYWCEECRDFLWSRLDWSLVTRRVTQLSTIKSPGIKILVGETDGMETGGGDAKDIDSL